MTNLKPVEGMNKYCGPAVLATLTGRSTDDCAWEISKVNGQYTITGVVLKDLITAAKRMGFDCIQEAGAGSLFRTLTTIVGRDGMYIVMVPNHYVCIEVKDKKIYFCDNHTKEPIPAASSARMMQKVDAIYRVVPVDVKPYVPLPKIEKPKLRHVIKKVFVRQPDGIFTECEFAEIMNWKGEHTIRIEEEEVEL